MKKLALVLVVLIVILCMAIPSFAADGYGLGTPFSSSYYSRTVQYFSASNVLDASLPNYSLDWSYPLAVTSSLRITTVSDVSYATYYIVPVSAFFGEFSDSRSYIDNIRSSSLASGSLSWSSGSYVDVDVSFLDRGSYFLCCAYISESVDNLITVTGFMFTKVNSSDIVVSRYYDMSSVSDLVSLYNSFSSEYPYSYSISMTLVPVSRWNTYLYASYYYSSSVFNVYSFPNMSGSSSTSALTRLPFDFSSGFYSLRFFSSGGSWSYSDIFSGVYVSAVYSPQDKESYYLRQDIVSALDDPSFGSTDAAGEALGSATENAGNVLSSGSSKEDSIVSEALAGADTSQFDSVIQDTSLLAGLSFWKGFLEFTYDNLQFFKVLLGLCISVGTIALVVGVSGRVKRYISSRKGDDEE